MWRINTGRRSKGETIREEEMNQPGNIDSNFHDVSSTSSSCCFTGGDQLVLEILSRLPVKSLMRFKCVCKSWLSIIKNDPYFIDLHSRRSKARPVFLLKAQVSKWQRYFLSADLRLPSEIGLERGVAVCQRQSDFAISEGFHYTLEANGILCFVDKRYHHVRIYNPSTRESTPYWITSIIKQEADLILRDGNCQITYENLGRYEFGYDPATKEYKVIALWRKRMHCYHECLCEVLTVGRQNNSWRKIKDVPPANLNYLTGSAHANGSIYWLNYNNFHKVHTIVEFNIGTEKFRGIPLPSFIIDDIGCDYNRTELMDFGGRLALFSFQFDISITSLKLFVLGNNSSNDNFGWREEMLLSIPPFDSCKNSISCVMQPVQGTDLLIVRGSHDFSFYYYNWKRNSYSSSKWEIDGIDTFPVPPCKMIDKYLDYEVGFYIYTENLFPVK